MNKQKELILGDLSSVRDWGYAPDYVKGMWLMLQQSYPQDFVLATGKVNSIRELCEVAFSSVGLDYQKYVRSSSSNYRPMDVIHLKGDYSKAARLLSWKPRKSFRSMIVDMVKHDISLITTGVSRDISK